MSWCRFSSPVDGGYTSDLYVFETYISDENERAVSINVANRRQIGVENAPALDENNFVESYYKRNDYIREHCNEYESIGLKYDGISTVLCEPEEIKSFLWELKSLGYRFPNDVYDSLEEYKNRS